MVSNDDPSNSWTQKATTWEMAQARSPKTASNISRCKRSAYGRRPASALARSRSVDTNSACVGSDGNYGDGCGDGGGDGFNSHADSDYDGSLAKGSVFRSTLTSRSALRASLSSSSLSTMSDINSCISETEPFPFGEEQHLQDENWHPNVLKPLDKMHLKDYSKCRDFSSLANDGQSWGMSQTLKLQKGICNTTANGEKATQGTTCTSNRLFDKILINRNEASPSGLSNRKRGVCASPLDIDDVGECVIDSHGIPVERRRSRFRVLSPHKSLKKSLIDEENYFPPRESLDVSFCSTAASMDSDSDASMEENEKIVCSEGNVHTQNLQRLQTAPKVGHRCLIPLSEISEDHPQFQVMIKAIPSFDDLKFLLRLMRKDLKEKHTHSFGVRSKNSFITIAIPNQWTSDRKAKFLTWATTGEDSTDTTPGLGFNLRAAGGNVFFLQIVRKRGEIVRNFLELSFQHMKTSMKAGTETGMKTSIPICSQKLMKKHMSTQPLTNRSNEIPDENKMFFDLTTPRPRSQTLPCTSFVRRDSSSALSTKMENLQVSISSSIKAPPPSTTKLNESLVRTVTLESVDTLKLALTEKQARNSRRASFKVSKFNEPPVGVQDLFAGKSSSPRMKLRRRPVKHHSDMPTKDNSGSPLQALRKSRPRHSGEHSIGGQDLLLHMGCHGLTPKSNVRKHYGSTPKASFTPKRDHKSKRSGRIKKCLTLNTEDEYTPKPQSSDSFQYPPMPSSRKPLDTPILEMLET
uniref:Uncharacterized protein n=2 Tax=Corethron hystrix TaxID=216773 RepID=A0A7S1FTB9_9STRA|mmetsp:Transcript_27379/g.62856  ORF Transcript_27379/g.62856 Transcript_27379/m.62856 type:complete len:748 (+) Transcript_27379:483-2726(+)